MCIRRVAGVSAATVWGWCWASGAIFSAGFRSPHPPYTQDWSEAGGCEHLWRAAERHLIPKPLSGLEVGDVLLFRMRRGAVAKHLGIQSAIGAEACFIHAYSGRGVVESRLDGHWARRIVARFEFPKGP